MESLENRRLLSAINALSDEFDDPATLNSWQRINETEGWNADQLDQWDIGNTRDGQMSLIPNTVTWYQDYRGPLVFKEVTGDFVITSRLEITDRDDIGGSDDDNVPSDGAFSLGGIMIRTPREISSPADWIPGTMADDGTNNGENYVFLSMGHGAGTNDNGFTLEVKSTRNSDSQLELTPLESDNNSVTFQTARIGSSIITMYQRPGEAWQVHRRFARSDMPETLQVGMVTYSDYDKVATYSPFYHNGNRLDASEFDPVPEQPFSPDINVGFDYARFAEPQVPVELEGVDLINEATDEQLLSFLGAHANTTPDGADEIIEIGDQIMSRQDDVLQLDLTPTVDGQLVSYQATVVQNEAAALSASENLQSFRDDFGLDWGGQDEKWLLGDNGYVYLLPSGDAFMWNGSFETSTHIATLSAAYYQSPLLLVDAQPVDVEVQIAGSQLEINPSDTFAGDLQVRLEYQFGESNGSQTFGLSVVNAAPEFGSLSDQSMTVGETGLVVDLISFDADGDLISYQATVAGSDDFELVESLGLYDAELENYAFNWGGHQEKWLQGNTGWHFLTPDGSLSRWEGSFEASVVVATPGVERYADPSLLLNASPLDVEVDIVGDQLMIDAGTQSGQFAISVVATDGFVEVERSFLLNVTNELPVLPIADQVASIGETLDVELPASDADGHAVDYSVTVLGTSEQQLDQQFEFWSNGDYHFNWGGQNEKWIRDASNDWFYLTESGSVFRWTGSFAESDHVAVLDASVYETPELLTDPEPTDLEASVVGNTLQIQTGTSASVVRLHLQATDGFSVVEKTILISVMSDDFAGIDSLFSELTGGGLL